MLNEKNLSDIDEMASAVQETLVSNMDRLVILLQLVGLTRNKIIQDIKAHARNEKLKVSTSSPEALFNTRTGANLASQYLANQLIRVFGHTKGRCNSELLEALNQATWLGYIRQERAKRSGHEAEYRLACILNDLGLPFAPKEKADNPLCRDAQVDGVSYDIVSPSVANPLMRVKATVHTSNIGQYGESKDALEMREAVESINKSGSSDITLLAFIDGVGFESNSAGLDGVLTDSDEFCQFRTMWKAAAIAAVKSNRRVRVALPRDLHSRFENFADRWKVEFVDRDALGDSPEGWVETGDGFTTVIN